MCVSVSTISTGVEKIMCSHPAAPAAPGTSEVAEASVGPPTRATEPTGGTLWLAVERQKRTPAQNTDPVAFLRKCVPMLIADASVKIAPLYT